MPCARRRFDYRFDELYASGIKHRSTSAFIGNHFVALPSDINTPDFLVFRQSCVPPRLTGKIANTIPSCSRDYSTTTSRAVVFRHIPGPR
ncbi:hypothetical protein KCP75_09825 [Salmonella enterica subsp. enterica]|nr:hypothetical protein KCP75_09825 [Salmonella enterica subsp. enterica]